MSSFLAYRRMPCPSSSQRLPFFSDSNSALSRRPIASFWFLRWPSSKRISKDQLCFFIRVPAPSFPRAGTGRRSSAVSPRSTWFIPFFPLAFPRGSRSPPFSMAQPVLLPDSFSLVGVFFLEDSSHFFSFFQSSRMTAFLPQCFRGFPLSFRKAIAFFS